MVHQMENDFILTLYSRSETVFTLRELLLLFPQISYNNLKSKIHYFAMRGKMQRLRTGIYAKTRYNPLELVKIYTPSYISLETVLQREGLIFQYSRNITAISYVSRTVTVGETVLKYKKMNDRILLNNEGIRIDNGYCIASKERAFLDTLLLYGDFHFDTVDPLCWDTVFLYQKLYANKSLEKRVQHYYQNWKEQKTHV